MAEPFIAEIRVFPFDFAPKGWAWCDGQLLPVAQNGTLFHLLGATYGGDGRNTFALPDLQGRAPMHPGEGPGLSSHFLGENGGTDTVTLLESELPSHLHTARAVGADPADLQAPSPSRAVARSANGFAFVNGPANATLAAEALAPAGADVPHNNMQPYLTFFFSIALQGVFPPRG